MQIIDLEIPAGLPYNQSVPSPDMSKDTAHSGFSGRKAAQPGGLSPYLDNIGGKIREHSSRICRRLQPNEGCKRK